MKLSFSLLAPLSLLMVSCGVSPLSESDAKGTILGSDEMEQIASNVRLIPNYEKSAIEQGVISDDNGPGRLIVRPEARAYISNSNTRSASSQNGFKVEISAINVLSFDDMAEVEFSWLYRDLPPYVRRFAIAGGSGNAHFRKSDKGWVLRDVSTTPDLVSRYGLSGTELQVIQDDILEERTRQSRITKLLQECRTSSTNLFKRSYPQHPRHSDAFKFNLTITDSEIILEKIPHYTHEKPSVFWLGNVIEVRRRVPENNYHWNGLNQFTLTSNKTGSSANFSINNIQEDAIGEEIRSEILKAATMWRKKCGGLPSRYS